MSDGEGWVKPAWITDRIAECHDSHGEFGLCQLCVRHGRLEGARIVRDYIQKHYDCYFSDYAKYGSKTLAKWDGEARRGETLPDDAQLQKLLIEGEG